MIYRSRSFTFRQVLSMIIIFYYGKWIKMTFVSISTCNWNDTTSVISFCLADSTHFKFKIKKLEVKRAVEFALILEKSAIL